MSGIQRLAKAYESPIVFKEARSLAPTLHAWQVLSLDMNQFVHGKQPLFALGVKGGSAFPAPFSNEPHKNKNFIARPSYIENIAGSDKTPVKGGHLDEHDEADFFMTWPV
jgi:hypothetical protein